MTLSVVRRLSCLHPWLHGSTLPVREASFAVSSTELCYYRLSADRIVLEWRERKTASEQNSRKEFQFLFLRSSDDDVIDRISKRFKNFEACLSNYSDQSNDNPITPLHFYAINRTFLRL